MEGFTVGKGMEYAAIPFGDELMIIHKGKQLKVCKTEDDARNYINSRRKGKSEAKLPLDG
jgi:hypothetical protein